MTAPDHTLRKSENPCIEGGIQTCTPKHTEIHIRATALNRYTTLGILVTEPVG